MDELMNREAAPSALWYVLRHQAALFTSGESTSLSEGTARAVGASVRFSLRLHLDTKGIPYERLLRMTPGEVEKLFREAEETVRRAVKRAAGQYARVRRCLYQAESQSLAATITSIGDFFRAYDPRFFAAEIPCDIDYPLAQCVTESLEGVQYIRAYLDRLLVENAFLGRFAPQSLQRVWAAAIPGHRVHPLNLYEAAATAALVVTMAEGDLFELALTAEQEETLLRNLREKEPQLPAAAKTLARRLALNREEETYLAWLAVHTGPRLCAAAEGGTLRTMVPIL